MNRLIDNILLAVSTVGILIAIKHFVSTQIVLYSIIMVLIGLVILIFGSRIINGEPSVIKTFFTQSAGILLFVGGINLLAEHYSIYYLIFGVVGILLYNYHHLISERL